MQLHTTILALTALGGVKIASSHIVRTPLAPAATMDGIDDTAAPALLSSAGSVSQASLWVPHDVPDYPHCTWKGPDSRRYMVFSKDFGRHDDTSQDGCGNHMLLRLREGMIKIRPRPHASSCFGRKASPKSDDTLDLT